MTSPQQRRQTSGALSLGKEIVKAFKEEVLTSSSPNQDNIDSSLVLNDSLERQPDYSDFRIPSNTHAIAIDDSKIQRKLIRRYFELCGIPACRTTIVGQSYNEIMGFEGEIFIKYSIRIPILINFYFPKTLLSTSSSHTPMTSCSW